jgi:kynurenine formamidase
LEDVSEKLKNTKAQAVIIRTKPNTAAKKSKKYSNTNWPYLDHKAATYLRDLGVKHVLIDLPSVDKEKDNGALLAHKAFWNIPEAPRTDATITEFIYVPDTIKDGAYVLNLQLAPF